MTTKALPHSHEAEAAVLGAMIRNDSSLADAVQRFGDKDFYIPAHRIVFNAMRELFSQGETVDEVTICGYLSDADRKKAGNVTYITSLRDMAPMGDNSYAKHCEIVEGATIRRKLIYASQRIVEAAHDISDTPTAALELAEQEIYAIGQKRDAGLIYLTDALGDVYADSVKASQEGARMGAFSGFETLDSITGGFRPGQLCVLAARPGVGKSALATNMAVNMAKDGKVVVFFGLEMDHREIALRILADSTHTSTRAILNGKASAGQYGKMLEYIDSTRESKLIFSKSMNVMPPEVRATLMQIASKEKRVDMVIIDYLQLMYPEKRGENRNLEIGKITRDLKVLAQNMDVTVLALSQLNRDAKGGAPDLTNLRDSGAIEQDADVVMLMHRDIQNTRANAVLSVSKNRSGPLGMVSMAWNGPRCAYTDNGPYDNFED